MSSLSRLVRRRKGCGLLFERCEHMGSLSVKIQDSLYDVRPFFSLSLPAFSLLIPMRQYLELMRHVLEHGCRKSDRTGTGTLSIFGHQMRFDLSEGFPLVTTKKCHLKSIIFELLWFLRGDTNIKYLKENGVSIWDEWADENGDLGPIYGRQLRAWPDARGGHIDQSKQVIEQIKNTPDSRRMVVSSWNVGELPEMKLAPCHAL